MRGSSSSPGFRTPSSRRRIPSSASSFMATSSRLDAPRACPRGDECEAISLGTSVRRSVLDLSVGLFLIIGLLAVGWLSVRLGRVDLLGGRGYVVSADFPTVGG